MIQCLAVIPSVLVDTTKDYVVLSERELHFHTKTFQWILTWVEEDVAVERFQK